MIERLMSIPWYQECLARAGGRQEVMVGYSDSAKDVGRVGRGGGPTYLAIQSQPPGSVGG